MTTTPAGQRSRCQPSGRRRALSSTSADALLFYAAQVARRAQHRLPVLRDGRPAPAWEQVDNAVTAAHVLEGLLHELGSGRAWHPSGLADASGWAGMAVTEILVHGHDAAAALGVELALPGQVCARTVARVFPWVSLSVAEPEQLLLAVTGRARVSVVPADPQWWWQSAPLSEWDRRPRRRSSHPAGAEAHHPSQPCPGQVRCRLRLVSGVLVVWEAEHEGRQARRRTDSVHLRRVASPWLHKSSLAALSRFPKWLPCEHDATLFEVLVQLAPVAPQGRGDAGRTQPPLLDHQGTVPRSDIGPDRPSARNDPQSAWEASPASSSARKTIVSGKGRLAPQSSGGGVLGTPLLGPRQEGRLPVLGLRSVMQ